MKLARVSSASSLCASLAVGTCWANNFCTNATGHSPTFPLSLSSGHLIPPVDAILCFHSLLPSEAASCHNGFDKHTKWPILPSNWLYVVTILTQYVCNYSSMYSCIGVWKCFTDHTEVRAGSPQPWMMNFSSKLPAAHTQRKWAAKFTPTWLLMNDITRTLE